MTPQENRRRLQALRFVEQKDTKEGTRKSPKQLIHNSAEALWIKKINEGGQGSRLPHHPHSEKIA